MQGIVGLIVFISVLLLCVVQFFKAEVASTFTCPLNWFGVGQKYLTFYKQKNKNYVNENQP